MSDTLIGVVPFAELRDLQTTVLQAVTHLLILAPLNDGVLENKVRVSVALFRRSRGLDLTKIILDLTCDLWLRCIERHQHASWPASLGLASESPSASFVVDPP
jgi:hypothetical protein